MTSLRRLGLVTGVMLFSAAVLPVGCNALPGGPGGPPQPDSAVDAPSDATHRPDRHDARAPDVGVDTTPPLDSKADSTDARDATTTSDASDAMPADAGTNCTSVVKNGTETDVGCGGPVCPACVVGKHCALNRDCASPAVCVVPEGGVGEGGVGEGGVGGAVCNLASCHDGMKDGDETGIDCGGPTCAACATGQGCLVGTDCVSRVCSGMLCQAPTCSDGVKNGSETDIDCGGIACPACFVGKQCLLTADCKSDICTSNTCSCPPNMVIVPTNLPEGGDYCVDELEVTYSEYYTFWISDPAISSQPSFCSWNSTYTPINGWPPDLTTADPSYNGGNPVNWVNWCQAYGYCAQQGKRLCGQIAGGSNATTDSSNAMKSEWFNACSANGVNTYPYGSSYVPKRCNDTAVGLSAPWPELNSSGTLVNDLCQGGAAGLYQMSGNVAEWEDSCNILPGDSGTSGASDTCLLRGGSFNSTASGLTCATAVPMARNYQGADTGFRCCL